MHLTNIIIINKIQKQLRIIKIVTKIIIKKMTIIIMMIMNKVNKANKNN